MKTLFRRQTAAQYWAPSNERPRLEENPLTGTGFLLLQLHITKTIRFTLLGTI